MSGPLERGLEEAANGEVDDLGDFTQYLDHEDIDWGEVNIFMDEELEALAREDLDYYEDEEDTE